MKDHIRKILQGMIEDGVPGAKEFLDIHYDDDQTTVEDVEDMEDMVSPL